MEQHNPNGIRAGVLLLDHYDEMARMLKDSFRSAGFLGPVIVLSQDAALPKDVSSLYRIAASDSKVCDFPAAVQNAMPNIPAKKSAYRLAHAGWTPGEGRFFNQIEIPDLWVIKADSSSARVYDRNRLRGRIFYARTEASRIVHDVDWLDEDGKVRFTDHYDLEGTLYARTTFNEREERFCCSWFDEAGRERVVENYVTGDIMVTRNGAIQRFTSRKELCIAILRELGLEGQRIFYNSLSTPFFVSEALYKSPRGNVLFWQECPRDDIPGNMQAILRGNSHTSEIYVQNDDSCKKLLELGASYDFVHPFGFLYDFVRENTGSDNILICTNSDQIESLGAIVEGLPEMTFHIAAITEMSSKLLSFGSEPNVHLYPVASKRILCQLYKSCDWYLDINYGSEIFSSVKRAFLNNHIILGFSKTLHRPRYLSSEHIFDRADDLISAVRQIKSSESNLQHHLELQRIAAMAETTEAYQSLLD